MVTQDSRDERENRGMRGRGHAWWIVSHGNRLLLMDAHTYPIFMNIHRRKGREVHTLFMLFSIKNISIRRREINFKSINAISIIDI